MSSVILALAFVRQERRAEEPIVALSILRDRGVWAPLLATALFGFANFSVAIFVPLFGLVVQGVDAVQAGYALTALTAGLLISGIVTGRLAARSGRYRRYGTAGLTIYATGMFCLATADVETSRAAFLFFNFLLGIGSGTFTPVVVASLQDAVDPRDLGVASSLPGFSRAVFQTVGTSVFGAFFASRAAHHLARDVAPTAPPGLDVQAFVASPDAIRSLEGPLREAVVESYSGAFNESFLAMASVVLLGLIVTRAMRDRPAHADDGRADA